MQQLFKVKPQNLCYALMGKGEKHWINNHFWWLNWWARDSIFFFLQWNQNCPSVWTMQITARRLSWALQNGTAYFDNQVNFKQLLRKLKDSLCKLVHWKELKKNGGRGRVFVDKEFRAYVDRYWFRQVTAMIGEHMEFQFFQIFLYDGAIKSLQQFVQIFLLWTWLHIFTALL